MYLVSYYMWTEPRHELFVCMLYGSRSDQSLVLSLILVLMLSASYPSMKTRTIICTCIMRRKKSRSSATVALATSSSVPSRNTWIYMVSASTTTSRSVSSTRTRRSPLLFAKCGYAPIPKVVPSALRTETCSSSTTCARTSRNHTKYQTEVHFRSTFDPVFVYQFSAYHPHP